MRGGHMANGHPTLQTLALRVLRFLMMISLYIRVFVVLASEFLLPLSVARHGQWPCGHACSASR
jgi:hypothetical protein